MKNIDALIGYISPYWAFQRTKYRNALAAYEAAEPSRFRKKQPDNRSGDELVSKSGDKIRGYARLQEQNYDLVEGVLATLVDNVVGPNGISLEPLPKKNDGSIDEQFASEISALRKDWKRRPEVTWELDWTAAERLLCRAWLRDGEALIQTVEGNAQGMNHGTIVPFSVELIEADLLPMHLTRGNITQGVERSAWGKPIAYHLYKKHPGGFEFMMSQDTKRVEARFILHPKIVKRFRQARGVSIFAPMLRRLEDIKDYEESERIAARVAAAMCAYIKKGAADDYIMADKTDGNKPDRSFKVQPGMVFDTLLPGEEVGSIDANRPSTLLEGFRDSMVRMIAAASRGTFSSIARKYDGTYSAQRQELVEGWIGYSGLSSLFSSQVTYPVHKRFIDMAILSGALIVPNHIDANTLYDADCRGPAMPWIDPDKEEKANERSERAGHKSAQQIIRGTGRNPDEVMREIAVWRKKAHDLGIIFTTDPKHEITKKAPPDDATDDE